ncbi:MAG: RecX family transcriptional regulator [Candidatus Levyibacteriota bacterium]
MESFERFYNKALRFLSFRPRSEKELRDYFTKPRRTRFGLAKSKISKKMLEKIVFKLKKQRFLDDKEFTKWWIEQRIKIRPRAWRIIKLELARKGISQEVSDPIIQALEFKIQNDLELAKRLVSKRINRYKGFSEKDAYQKMVRFLASKGFKWETIKKVLVDD